MPKVTCNRRPGGQIRKQVSEIASEPPAGLLDAAGWHEDARAVVDDIVPGAVREARMERFLEQTRRLSMKLSMELSMNRSMKLFVNWSTKPSMKPSMEQLR